MITYSDRPADGDAPGRIPPVVLIHGTLGNAHTWDPVADDLARFARVIAVNLPGVDDSPFMGDATTLDDFARAVVEVLDHEGIEKAVWIGHSLGGLTASQALGVCPGRVAGLVLAYSTARADSPGKRSERDETIASAKDADFEGYVTTAAPAFFRDDAPQPIVDAYVRQGMTWQGVESVVRSSTAVRDRPDREPDLRARPEIPALVVAGADDDFIEYMDPDDHEHVSHVVTDTGHMGVMTSPHTFAGIFIGWVRDRVRAGGG